MIDNRIKDLVPSHYRESAPRFITFLEKYYEWLYRSSGLSTEEIDDLRNDTSWLEKDIDRFISTGQLKYIDQSDDVAVVETSLVQLNNIGNPGGLSTDLPKNYTLDDDFRDYSSNDGSVIQDTNNDAIDVPTVENRIIDGWFNSMGLDRIKRYRMDALDNIDQVLMLSLMKHIYSIKGTEASMKIFFRLYFDEEVTIHQPKSMIAVVDDNWVLDGIQVLRDDELYQEFSYVIIVSKDLEFYRDIFKLIYMKMVHPSGFRVALIKSEYYNDGKIDPDAEYLLG
jgi:hypothetical protein